MNRGEVPGCVVTDDLYRIIEEEAKAPDKGKTARLTRAAKLIAILKGMGYDGVHIGGPNLKYEDVEWVIEKSKEFSTNWEDWVREFSFPQKNGFYLFMRRIRKQGSIQTSPLSIGATPQDLGIPDDAFLPPFCFPPEAPLFKPARWFFQED